MTFIGLTTTSSSLTLVMTPEMGVEETQGMTFDRKTGELRPLSYYYSGTDLENSDPKRPSVPV